MSMWVSANEVADTFLKLADDRNIKLVNRQLQNLVYIANGYCLAIYDEPLYYNAIYAWQFGPVIPKLYEPLRKYGSGVVTEYLCDVSLLEVRKCEREDIIRGVLDGYVSTSSLLLNMIVCKDESPWSITWGVNSFGTISEKVISEYYKNLIGDVVCDMLRDL